MYRYSSCIFKSDNDNMWYPVLNHVLFMEFWKSAQCKIQKEYQDTKYRINQKKNISIIYA